MRRYQKSKQSNPFGQGFIFGLIFGSLGALIMLGRDRTPEQTLAGILPEPPEGMARLNDPGVRVAHTEPAENDQLSGKEE